MAPTLPRSRQPGCKMPFATFFFRNCNLKVFTLKTILWMSLRLEESLVHVISKKRLVVAGVRYPDALPSLMRWYRVARRAQWHDIHETRADFPHADPVGKFTVFNIRKNEYRLITVFHYNRLKVYIRAILTHDEYDKGTWKRD